MHCSKLKILRRGLFRVRKCVEKVFRVHHWNDVWVFLDFDWLKELSDEYIGIIPSMIKLLVELATVWRIYTPVLFELNNLTSLPLHTTNITLNTTFTKKHILDYPYYGICRQGFLAHPPSFGSSQGWSTRCALSKWTEDVRRSVISFYTPRPRLFHP